ncbi:MAG: hypothetical protein CFE45_25500 [Burkholderiales bacterium PBB5]|nr:MAG: hypothetical protein CFE45_25500 [Burkholderiales bacterium PBB5]
MRLAGRATAVGDGPGAAALAPRSMRRISPSSTGRTKGPGRAACRTVLPNQLHHAVRLPDLAADSLIELPHRQALNAQRQNRRNGHQGDIRRGLGQASDVVGLPIAQGGQIKRVFRRLRQGCSTHTKQAPVDMPVEAFKPG